MRQRTYAEGEPVDFVVVGSGAAGGVLAKELASSGFDVVVLEAGPWQHPSQFRHDELATERMREMLNVAVEPVQTFRASPSAPVRVRNGRGLMYRRGVGGSSVHFTANYWRLRPTDFDERSRWGAIPGANVADWPIDYDELEPYYAKVDWEIGVSGTPGPADAFRSRPFPMPPLPNKSSGVLLERAAARLGLHAQVAPMAIVSQPYEGRTACQACGHCMFYGCEYGAKSSTLVTMIPKALATGRCEVRAESTAFRVETGADGRATGVLYFDAQGRERRQRARVVVLAANGAESARLLLLSASSRHPDGLANSSGQVGRNIMFNGHASTAGRFAHPLNEYKGAVVSRIVHDFYDTDPARGCIGGGGIDARFSAGPIGFALDGLPEALPRWGADYKRALAEFYTHTVRFAAHTTSLAVESNAVSLDPDHRDRFGRPALRLTFAKHPEDAKLEAWFGARTQELMDAAGAEQTWTDPPREGGNAVHLLGTARMGHDARTSVVDRYHRAHDVRNLFVCDGSSLPTSGRGQPTMTIQALAFRAAEHMGRLAREHAL